MVIEVKLLNINVIEKVCEIFRFIDFQNEEPRNVGKKHKEMVFIKDYSSNEW